ncbi:MAG: glycosyltransferase [Eubacteriales bacterium]|nr:glycosyltransferase [Eubacteriales bacterium]
MRAHAQKNDPIRILYASSLVSAETFSALFSRGETKPSLAAQKYHALLTRGLAANGVSVTALSVPPVSRRTSGRRLVRLPREEQNGIRFRYLLVLVVPVIKHFSVFCGAFFFTLWFLKRGDYAVCDGLNIALSTGVRLAARLKRRPCAAIVTDVPEILAGGKSRTAMLNTHVLGKFDGYILLTEAMNDLVNPHARPYLVAEGQVDAAMSGRENLLGKKYPEKVCLYAGMLHAAYGVIPLAAAFRRVPDPAARLVFYGQGDVQPLLEKIAEEDDRIELRGVMDNASVVAEELKATLLINPRPSGEAFTAYSFPSKNLEYMVSGTPVLTTKLCGMPREYDSYAYLLEDESVEGMAKTLSEVLSQPRETLHAKGAAAKEFVLKHKSNTAQAARVVAFLRKLDRR